MSKGRGKAKGTAWERTISVMLSEWWTQREKEPRSDVFWRTATSGGRATQRSKGGKSTRNSAGDLCAIDPEGQPFLELFTVEIKKGYNRSSIGDILDKPKGAKEQMTEGWISKLEATKTQSGSHSWLLICQRDRREPLVFFPGHTYQDLENVGALTGVMMGPVLSIEYDAHDCNLSGKTFWVRGMHLRSFLNEVTPEDVIRVLAKYARRGAG